MIQTELQNYDDYEKMNKKEDLKLLLKKIKEISCNFSYQNYLPGNIWRAYKAMFVIKQKGRRRYKIIF